MRKINLLLLLLLSMLTYRCADKVQSEDAVEALPKATELVASAETTLSENFTVNFNSTPPKDLAADASPEQLIQFAWEEFIALTWKSSFNSDGKRDQPDSTWSWQNYTDAYPDLVVWETYAHRTELRPGDNNMQPFDNAPHYSFLEQPKAVNTGDSFTLFNNLDENNEIGSCNLYAHYNDYGKENMVLYQAKVNRDEYDYILNNYPDSSSLKVATAKTLSNINTYKAYYQGATGTCNCPSSEGVICLPCGGTSIPGNAGETYTGAMEIKTAWRKLKPEDDPTKYFMRNVIYYEKDTNGATVYSNGEFALIGIHIIHKTTNYPGFVFATFEHNTVEQDDMAFVLLNAEGTGDSIDPKTGQPAMSVDYDRFHPIPDVVVSANAAVHDQMTTANPNTIWANYQLVGVQGKPTEDTTSFSYYLANYVIESDPALADFHGNSIGTPFNGMPNLLSDGKLITMGGCKGCHGVGQITLGTDFSFLLDNIGKPVKEPDVLEMPGLPATKLEELSAYIKATSAKK